VNIDTSCLLITPCSMIADQGLWQLSMVPIKTGTGSHGLRSKRVPTISVLIGKSEECPTPCMPAAHQHRSRSCAAINHLLFGDVIRPHPSLAVPIAKKLHSLMCNRGTIKKAVGASHSSLLSYTVDEQGTREGLPVPRQGAPTLVTHMLFHRKG